LRNARLNQQLSPPNQLRAPPSFQAWNLNRQQEGMRLRAAVPTVASSTPGLLARDVRARIDWIALGRGRPDCLRTVQLHLQSLKCRCEAGAPGARSHPTCKASPRPGSDHPDEGLAHEIRFDGNRARGLEERRGCATLCHSREALRGPVACDHDDRTPFPSSSALTKYSAV